MRIIFMGTPEFSVPILSALNEKYEVVIPWYIMVSRENKEETVKFFEEKNYLYLFASCFHLLVNYIVK